MDGRPNLNNKAAFSNFSGVMWMLSELCCHLYPGGLEMEGVYRVNGGQLTMKKLRTSFDQGKLYFCERRLSKTSCYELLLASNSAHWT